MIGKVEADFPLCQPLSMFRKYVVCELDPHSVERPVEWASHIEGLVGALQPLNVRVFVAGR